ncbi:MAG TPA: hypothetical protein VFC99_11455 [Acidimicrobiia bacterium]|nr:hypothetical protein [Acidimicrobiia bacterium]
MTGPRDDESGEQRDAEERPGGDARGGDAREADADKHPDEHAVGPGGT